MFAVLSGILTILALPPFSLGFLAYFCLIPLFYIFIRDDFYYGFEKGLIFGFVLNLGVLYWLAVNQGANWYWAFLSMIIGVLFLSLGYGVGGFFLGYLGRRFGRKYWFFTVPFIWTSMEFLRTFGVLGFNWNNLCYTQVKAVQLIQHASIFGSHGVSYWIVLVNIVFFLIIRNLGKGGKDSRNLVIVLGLLFLIPEVYGLIKIKRYENNANKMTEVSIGLIQPNVDPNEKWVRSAFKKNMQLLYDLTDSISIKPLHIVVWPETATPTYLRRNYRNTMTKIFSFLEERNLYLLTGTPDYDIGDSSEYKFFNSTFFVDPYKKEYEKYRKIKLVPFGEYIPLSEVFPDLKKLNLGQGNFLSGDEIKVFEMPITNHESVTDTLHFSSAICYESTFPTLILDGSRLGSEMLIIVSNDAWFGNTSAPYLHAEIARFRAIENGFPVIRSANTGISVIYDAMGQVIKKLDFGKRGWLASKVRISKTKTFYQKYGNWFNYLCVIISIGVVFLGFFRRKINE